MVEHNTGELFSNLTPSVQYSLILPFATCVMHISILFGEHVFLRGVSFVGVIFQPFLILSIRQNLEVKKNLLTSTPHCVSAGNTATIPDRIYLWLHSHDITYSKHVYHRENCYLHQCQVLLVFIESVSQF